MPFEFETEDQVKKAEALLRRNPDHPEAVDIEAAIRRARTVLPGPKLEPVDPEDTGFTLPEGFENVELFMRGLSNLPANLREGIMQFAADSPVGQQIPGADIRREEIDAERARRRINQEARALLDLSERDLPANTLPLQIGDLAGQVTPELVAAFATRRLPGALQRFLADTSIAGGAAAIQPLEGDESRGFNVLAGLTLGGGVSAIQNGSVAIRNFLNGDFRRPLLAEDTAEAVARARQLGFEGETALTPGQAARSPFLVAQERATDVSPGSARTQRLNAQAERAERQFTDIAATLARGNVSLGNFLPRARSAAEGAINKLRTVRRERWQGTMRLAETAADGQPVIPVDQGLRKLREVVDQARDPLSGIDPERLPALVRRLDALQTELLEQGGRMTPERFQNVLVAFTDEASGTGSIFRDLGTSKARLAAQDVQRAFLADLEEAAADPSTGIAGPLLQKARDDYALDSDNLDALRGTILDTVTRRTLQGAGVSETSFRRRVGSLEPSDARLFVRTLEEADPLLADQMRGVWFNETVQKHRIFNPTTQGDQLDLQALFKDLSKATGVLYPEGSIPGEITRALANLDRLAFGASARTGGAGSFQLAREVVTTGGSAVVGQGAPGFILRTLVGALRSPEQVERALLAPDAIEVLRQAGRPRIDQTTARVILERWGQIVVNREALEEQKEQERQQAEFLAEQQRRELQGIQQNVTGAGF